MISRFIAAGALICLSPLILLALGAALIGHGRPVFFRQKRIGQHGEIFEIIKLRSMRQSSGAKVTSAGDSRITSIGKLFRKSKLDELPQLWNVLRGEMAIFGPRPEVGEYVDMDDPFTLKWLELKPGISGWGSVVFRNEEELMASVDDKEDYYLKVVAPAKRKLDMEFHESNQAFKHLWLLYVTIICVLGLREYPLPIGVSCDKG